MTTKKLIEVALPLEAISLGCQEEKNPFLKGHSRALHLCASAVDSGAVGDLCADGG